VFAFRFNEPTVLLALWGVVALAVIAGIGIRRSRRLRLRFTRRAAELAPVDWFRRSVRTALVLLALALVVVGLARPSWSARRVTVQQRGRDVAFIVDVSRSMMAEDLVPNRLERAKLAILDAVPQLEGDRVAVLAFAGSAHVIAPLTRDYHFVRWAVESLSPASVERGGSLVGDALRVTTEEVFDPLVKRRKDVILLTDGEDQGSYPIEAAAAAGRNGVRLIVVGLGDSARGSRIPRPGDTEGYLTADGREVYSRLQPETLRQMASATPGGRYLDVGTGAFDLGGIYRNLILSEEAFAMGEVDIVQYEERFQLFLLVAFVLLIAAGLLGDRHRGGQDVSRLRSRTARDTGGSSQPGAARAGVWLIGALFGAHLLLAPAFAEARGASESVALGNEAYEENALQDALGYYEQAREIAPEESVPLYNLGVVLYRQENYPAALSAFQNMRTDSPELAALSHYNQGNSLARLGKQNEPQDPGGSIEIYRRSIAAYGRALDIDPDHERARRNIEVVRQWLEPLLEQARSQSDSEQGSQDSRQQSRQQDQQDSEGGSQEPSDPGEQSPSEPEQPPEDGPEAELDTEDPPAESAEAILEEEKQRRQEQADAAGRRDSGGSPTW
jgi:Ca-activated chloride channel family protein